MIMLWKGDFVDFDIDCSVIWVMNLKIVICY